MTIGNLPPAEIFDVIVGDFTDAWDSLAANPAATHRGNFLFGFLATMLLELACRLCTSDPDALGEFGYELAMSEPKYFTRVPGTCNLPTEFDLPSNGPDQGTPLLWFLYDLIRNGQVHQYQQIVATLTDGASWAIQLRGRTPMIRLDKIALSERQDAHLGYTRDQHGDVWLYLRPDIFFLDIKHAIETSKLLTRITSFDHLTRPRSGPKNRRSIPGPHYQFTAPQLVQCLQGSGHKHLP